MQILSKRIHNGYWLGSLLILCGLTAAVYLGDQSEGRDYDDSQFTLEVNSIITSVEISSESEDLIFDYVDGKWMVNNSFEMDPGMRDAFFTVISSIRVRRPVGNLHKDSLNEYLSVSGLKVFIRNNGEVIKSYLVGGNEISGISYFMEIDGETPYEVVLPGYDSYVAGLYSVPAIDWRSRFIFELDWSNLKSINVAYVDAIGFDVNYKEDFFYLDKNPEPIDSATMFDYIGELRNLQVQKYISLNQGSIYDSLVQVGPKATIMVEVIGESAQQLEIFEPIPGDRWVFARFNEDLLVQFDPRALSPILIQSDYWEQ